MKTFFEFLESCSELGYVHLNEGLFDKLFQKAMDKLAVLVGPERMGRLEAVLKKYDGQKKIDKKALEKELNGTFKTFKLDGSVAKEIQNECVDESGEPVNSLPPITASGLLFSSRPLLALAFRWCLASFAQPSRIQDAPVLARMLLPRQRRIWMI